jgi:hypothetical protein
MGRIYMYILRGIDVIGTVRVYTGKAGIDFVSDNLLSAFPFESLAGAQRKCTVLNKGSLLSGWRFIPMGFRDGGMIPASVEAEYLSYGL